MNKMRKVLITAAALGALAVGGAAFAQAQNATNVATPVVQQSLGKSGEHGSQAESQDAGSANEARDMPEANDRPDAQDVSGANDTPDSGESDPGPANEVEDGN